MRNFLDGQSFQKSPGADVIGQAEDGQRAVDLALALHPDVILMDVNMPGMNGIEATRIIHRESPEVRIVAFTMSDQSDEARAMREAGAVAFLSKNAPTNDLLAALQIDSSR